MLLCVPLLLVLALPLISAQRANPKSRCLRCPGQTLKSESFGGPSVFENGYAYGEIASCQYRGVSEYSGCIYDINTGDYLYRNAFDGAFPERSGRRGLKQARRLSGRQDTSIGGQLCPKKAGLITGGVDIKTPGNIISCVDNFETGERQRCKDEYELVSGTCSDISFLGNTGGWVCPGMNDLKGVLQGVWDAIDRRYKTDVLGEKLPTDVIGNTRTASGILNNALSILASRKGFSYYVKAGAQLGGQVAKKTAFGVVCSWFDGLQLIGFACDKIAELYYNCDDRPVRRSVAANITAAVDHVDPRSFTFTAVKRSDNICQDFYDTFPREYCLIKAPTSYTKQNLLDDGLPSDKADALITLQARQALNYEMAQIYCETFRAISLIKDYCGPGGVFNDITFDTAGPPDDGATLLPDVFVDGSPNIPGPGSSSSSSSSVSSTASASSTSSASSASSSSPAISSSAASSSAASSSAASSSAASSSAESYSAASSVSASVSSAVPSSAVSTASSPSVQPPSSASPTSSPSQGGNPNPVPSSSTPGVSPTTPPTPPASSISVPPTQPSVPASPSVAPPPSASCAGGVWYYGDSPDTPDTPDSPDGQPELPEIPEIPDQNGSYFICTQTVYHDLPSSAVPPPPAQTPKTEEGHKCTWQWIYGDSPDTPDTPDSPDGQPEIPEIPETPNNGAYYWGCK